MPAEEQHFPLCENAKQIVRITLDLSEVQLKIENKSLHHLSGCI